jgi:hypothetical protein
MEVEKNQKYSERKSTNEYKEQRKKFEQKTFCIIQFYF